MATVHRRSTETPTALIIGAGVIGLGIAWRLAQRGAAVTLFDRAAAGSGASGTHSSGPGQAGPFLA